jgi:catechol 2,3-dioxygenase-like lactoylglutathione lyase family enzyme
MITGLFETHIQVSDLQASIKFYSALPGLQLAKIDQERSVAFFWIGKAGKAMLGLWENKRQILPQHFAFRSKAHIILETAVPLLKSMHIECYNFLKDGSSKPMVFAWMPAIAIYFRDPDNHELEFISMLPQKPRPELGIISYEEWLSVQNIPDR